MLLASVTSSPAVGLCEQGNICMGDGSAGEMVPMTFCVVLDTSICLQFSSLSTSACLIDFTLYTFWLLSTSEVFVT